MRVGLGFDQRATLTDGLESAVLRAVVEAIAGASGLAIATADCREPGTADDPMAGQSVLRQAVQGIERENYQVVNLDVTVWAPSGGTEGARLVAMADSLAELVHVAPTNVSVKAGRASEVFGLSASDGVAAMAVTLLDQIADLDTLHASIRSGG